MSEPKVSQPMAGVVYRHYKGGLYTIEGIGVHHDTRELMVLYRSHVHGWINVRPLNGSAADPDGWLTPVKDADGTERPRFQLCESEVAT